MHQQQILLRMIRAVVVNQDNRIYITTIVPVHVNRKYFLFSLVRWQNG